MMGATLNPNSSVAKEMDACLKDEIQTHSAYDPSVRNTFHGVPFPGAKKNSHVSFFPLSMNTNRIVEAVEAIPKTCMA
jgi:hypothetical protein